MWRKRAASSPSLRQQSAFCESLRRLMPQWYIYLLMLLIARRTFYNPWLYSMTGKSLSWRGQSTTVLRNGMPCYTEITWAKTIRYTYELPSAHPSSPQFCCFWDWGWHLYWRPFCFCNTYSGRGNAGQDDLRAIKRVHWIIRLHLHGGHLPAAEGLGFGVPLRRVPMPGWAAQLHRRARLRKQHHILGSQDPTIATKWFFRDDVLICCVN